MCLKGFRRAKFGRARGVTRGRPAGTGHSTDPHRTGKRRTTALVLSPFKELDPNDLSDNRPNRLEPHRRNNPNIPGCSRVPSLKLPRMAEFARPFGGLRMHPCSSPFLARQGPDPSRPARAQLRAWDDDHRRNPWPEKLLAAVSSIPSIQSHDRTSSLPFSRIAHRVSARSVSTPRGIPARTVSSLIQVMPSSPRIRRASLLRSAGSISSGTDCPVVT